MDDALCFVLKILYILCVPKYMKTKSSWIYLFGIWSKWFKKMANLKNNKTKLKKSSQQQQQNLSRNNLYFCSEDYCFFLPGDSVFPLIQILWMSFDIKTSIAVCSDLNLLIVLNTELSKHTCLSDSGNY